MKQALQLKVGQSLTMTPQLQQAIKLLQMSSLDLQQEITRVLEENPLLEREDEIEQGSESSEISKSEQEIPVDSIEVAIETDWSDTNHFDLNRPMTRTASDDEYDSFENRTSENLTLADHLLWQLNLMPLTERDMLIARVLVDSINSDGFLDADLDEITKALAEELEDLEHDEVVQGLRAFAEHAAETSRKAQRDRFVSALHGTGPLASQVPDQLGSDGEGAQQVWASSTR